jgi:hypothetical protein
MWRPTSSGNSSMIRPSKFIVKHVRMSFMT